MQYINYYFTRSDHCGTDMRVSLVTVDVIESLVLDFFVLMKWGMFICCLWGAHSNASVLKEESRAGLAATLAPFLCTECPALHGAGPSCPVLQSCA